MASGTDPESPSTPAPVTTRLWPALLSLGALIVVGVVISLSVPSAAPPASGSGMDGWWPYVTIFLLIVGDAVVAVLPGETTLNVAATLSADGSLTLGLVMAAGALGAVVGDSALYGIARLMRGRIQRQLDKAMANEQIAKASEVIGSGAPMLLVFGRYVPGMRFVVNASLGTSAHPYSQFLRWSAVGGVGWSIYCCTVAYLVGTALVDLPVASVIVSALASSVAVAVVFFYLYRRLRRAPEADAPS